MKTTSGNGTVRKLAGGALLACVGFASDAMAQQSPFYVGASAGSARYDFNFADQLNALPLGNFPIIRAKLDNGSDTAFKLTLGYVVAPHVALELDYVDLGKIKASYEYAGLGRFPREDMYKISGLNISGVFSQSLSDQFSVFGRLGMLYSRYRFSEYGQNISAFTPSQGPAEYSFTAADLKRAKLSYGLGVDCKVTPATSLRLGIDRYTKIGNPIAPTETGNGKFNNIDLYSLGVTVRF